MHRRPDQQTDAPPSAVAPTQAAGILRARAVIIFGTGASAGLFVYNGTPALGNPPQVAIVPTGVTSDPFGNAITSSKILIQGNIITESGGIFRTAATSPLMQLDGPHNAFLVYDAAAVLRETIAPVATNDGLGNAVQAGFTAYTTGLFAQLQAASLSWGGTGITVAPSIGSGSSAFLQLASGQTAGNTVESILSLNPAAAGAVATALLNGALEIIEGAAPVADSGVNAGPKLFGNTSGHLEVRADSKNGDGNLYDTERVTLATTIATTISSTAFSTISPLSKATAIGNYHFRAHLMYVGNGVGGTTDTPLFRLISPAFSSGSAGLVGTGNAAAVAVRFDNASGFGTGMAAPSLTTGDTTTRFDVVIEGFVAFTIGGTLALQAALHVAGSAQFVIAAGSTFTLEPVVAT